MRIFGDAASSQIRTFVSEPGTLYGSNDVLVGERQTIRRLTFSFFGDRDQSITFQPKLYLHLSNTAWSKFTGLLREYCMPWAWQTAYLDRENGTQPERILVCTSAYGERLPDRLSKIIGQSLFVASLINSNRYDEILYREYLRIPGQGNAHENRVIHPLGDWAGRHMEWNTDSLCHIHRARGLFSLIKYHLLKRFSGEWEEAAIRTTHVSEKVLIKRNDRATILGSGLITSAPL